VAVDEDLEALWAAPGMGRAPGQKEDVAAADGEGVRQGGAELGRQ
jgi:hypothetical protein